MKNGNWLEWTTAEREDAIEKHALGFRYLVQLEEKGIMAREWSDLAGPMYFKTLVDLNTYKNQVINPVRIKWSVDLSSVKNAVMLPVRG